MGALITAFLSNDTTALILTPVVYALGTRLRLPALPFMFACTFIADTASFVLPVSNPINILILDALGSDLGAFLRYLALPALVCIALDIGLFTLIFRRSLGARYDVAAVAAPTFDRRFLRAVMGVLMVKEECGMRLLCAVGLSDGALVMREALALVRDSVEVIALYVIDEQPRRDAESPRGPLRHISPERRRELGQVEEEAGSA